jgi:type I restriction enzyme S subunit
VTNVNQLPPLPKGWLYARIQDISETTSGGTPSRKNKDFFSGDVPWLKSGELADKLNINFAEEAITQQALANSSAKIIPKGSLLIALYGATVGKLGLLTIDAAINQAICAIQPYQGVYPKYLFWYLNSYRKNFLNARKGGAQPNISQEIVRTALVPLAPNAEQLRIIAKVEELFSFLDAGVDLLLKIKTQLKRYRQAVLKCAFEGKLAEEWRKTHKDQLEPATKLLEKIKQERKEKLGPKYKEPPPIDVSGLSELPESWTWTRVGEISDLIHYGYTASSTTEPIGPKMLRITDIQANTVNWDDVPYCKIDDNTKQKYILRDGDLVFARTGATVGKSFLIKGNIPEAVFGSYLIRIILSKNVKKEFVYDFFHSPSYWLEIRKQQLGIGQPNVNSQTLARIVLPLPSLAEQDRIVEEIERRLSVVEETLKTMDMVGKQSERLRQTILNKAFSGKLVPQDPSDEPAEKLLERIREEREKSTSEKDINKKKIKPKQLELSTYVK